MRIEPHRNLTITLLRRNQFGSIRFAGSSPRRLGVQGMHLAQRLRVCPPIGAVMACSAGTYRLARAGNWPYHAAQPAGLTRLPDRPRPPGADNQPTQPILPQITTEPGRLTDAIGTRLDVLA